MNINNKLLKLYEYNKHEIEEEQKKMQVKELRRKEKALKEEFKNYKNYKRKIDYLIQEKERLDDREQISSIDYTKTKTSETYNINKKVEELALDKVSIEKMINQELLILRNRVKFIENTMHILDKREKEVLNMFYMEGLTWNDISIRVHLHPRRCRVIRDEAIRKILKESPILSHIF